MSSTAADGLGLERVFPGKSAMAARMRAFDWSTTDLGAPPTWPSTLRVVLRICLTAQLPMQIWWGPARTFFYNDACLPPLSATNQASLGGAGGEAWTNLVTQIGPEIAQVFTTDAANGPIASRLVFNGDHSPRERDVTFSFSPLLGESGAVEGPSGFVVSRLPCPARGRRRSCCAAVREDLPSVAGVYPLKDFPLFKAMMNGGVPLVVQDARITDSMDK